MLKLKINKKLIVALGIILLSIFILNINTVNAAVTEEQLQAMIDIIPDEITLDIQEVEYEKADKLIEEKVTEIWSNNGVSLEEINISVRITPIYMYTDNPIHSAEIRLNDKNKKISILYNNTNQKNTTDEQYVKNIMNKIVPIKYCESDLDFFS